MNSRPSARGRSAPAAARACLLAATLGLASAAVAQPRDADRAAVAVAVTTREAASLFVHPPRQALAAVVARNESRIGAEVGGVIQELGALVGESVERGALLARIDATDARLERDQVAAERAGALARRELAERQLRRARELRDQGFVSVEAVNLRESEKLALDADLARLDARLAIAQRRIDKAVIRAPFAGVVRERNAQLGELVSPGTPLFTLVQTGSPEVRADVPTDDAGRFDAIERFGFEIDGRVEPLALLRVSPVADAGTRTREARLRFVGEPRSPGVEGRLVWNDPRPHLPAAVLVRRAAGLGVFVVDGNRAVFRPVPGAQEGRPAPTSLDAGARVVVDGQDRLQDGTAVDARDGSNAPAR